MSAETNKKRLLLVDDDDLFRRSLIPVLEEAFEIVECECAEKALDYFREHEPDVAIFDIMLPGMDGIHLLKKFKLYWPDCPVLMLTALDQIPKVVEAIKSGAFDYLIKPPLLDELKLRIDRALESSEYQREIDQRRKLQQVMNNEYPLIGDSPAMKKIKTYIHTVADKDSTVLIQGETGSGKEIIARHIHACSRRAHKPFVAINCAAIPRELIESELFGHKKGSFTGALQDEKGKLFLAHQGTILFDEIGEMPLDAQAKLLRVIEEKEYYPVGSNVRIRTDIRIIASTNRNLKEMVARGLFREDLYYRLNIVQIVIPPLRKRPEDILAITQYYLQYFNLKFNKQISTISPEAEKMLLHYSWPGNVRELKNLIERIVLFEKGSVLLPEFLYLLETETSQDDEILPADSMSQPANGNIHEQLSTREQQVFMMIAQGKSITDIANELHVSVKTISTFRTRILMKLKIKTNADICYYAMKNGLI